MYVTAVRRPHTQVSARLPADLFEGQLGYRKIYVLYVYSMLIQFTVFDSYFFYHVFVLNSVHVSQKNATSSRITKELQIIFYVH